MVLPIILEPNKILHQVGRDLNLEEIKSNKIQKLIIDMIPTMYAKDGVGLAAPQVGESIQLCVIAKNYTPDQKKDLVLINPKWQKTSVFREWDEEGCLSVPETYGQVRRYKKIKVEALDETGKKINFVAENFFARIIQHEVDHLNGILFIEKAKNIRHENPLEL
jgi:peptide deformylase